jgi:chemotaxis methyl-accepting protein methylase
LISSPEEYDKLFEVLCINVSEFFRDPEVWVKVRALFAQLVKEKTRSGEKTIKIWSAGCANGEEPYTIAIVLKDLLQADILNFSVEVIATDVDKKSLRIAEEGLYAKESLKNMDKKLLARYFDQEGAEFRIKEEVKDLVAFQYLDLTSQNLVPERDLVFCRNVFIYFDRSLQEQLLMKFFNALRPGGHLIMGKSETLIKEATHIFQEIDLDSRLFKKV